VLTWNLLGSAGVDVTAVAAVIRSSAPDVVLLQEVQRGQARRLAAALGMRHAWRFKNLSWRTWSEGIAVLSPYEIGDVRRVVLRRSWGWTWRRRIALLARVRVDGVNAGGGGGVPVVSVHLSPHDVAEQRRGEVARLVAVASGSIVGGDVNELPGGGAIRAFEEAGWVDGWAAIHVDVAVPDAGAPDAGATNWTPGDRHGRAPTQRLDYVWVPPGFETTAARVPVAHHEYDDFARLSDHLPLVVSMRAEGASR